MELDVAGSVTFVFQFTVRQDKDRGVLVESFSVDGNEYFFKYHDKPIDRHCEQMQSIVRRSNVKRSKKLLVDVTTFSQEYYLRGKYVFKGTPLSSVQHQIEKSIALNTNKEIGAMKRRITYAENKPKRSAERLAKIQKNIEEDEKLFQVERAERIRELFRTKNSLTSEEDQSMTVHQISLSQNPEV